MRLFLASLTLAQTLLFSVVAYDVHRFTTSAHEWDRAVRAFAARPAEATDVRLESVADRDRRIEQRARELSNSTKDAVDVLRRLLKDTN